MKDKKLSLSIVQSDIFWGEVDQNIKHLDGLINREITSTDLIILPEMFTTGFSMNASILAERENGKAVSWLISKAKSCNAAITGSIIYSENSKFFNRLFWVNPSGEFFTYDKRHLFSMGQEDKFYEPGKRRLIVSYKGWRICPLICYDLRFPVWSRNKNEFDLLLYVANWPAARNHVWNILLRARAIENQCFVAGANRVGRDGENIHYIGESCVIHPKGYLASAVHEPKETIVQCTLSMQELLDFREKFPVLKDADQ